MGKIAQAFKRGRVILLILFLLMAVLAIWPKPFATGVTIQSIDRDSHAFQQGIEIDPNLRPTARERITALDNEPIRDVVEYYEYLDKVGPNRSVRVKTTEDTYAIRTNDQSDLGFSVTDAATSNVRKGLDLQGGTRVFLKPEVPVEDSILDDAVESLKLRLNIYGLSDISVRKVTNPDQYIIVEIAGATEQEVKDLVSRQGKFEAIIADEVIFSGLDVKFVGLGSSSALIDQCGPDGGGFFCNFRFDLTVSKEAADRFADVTDKLSIDGQHLSEPLVLKLDDEQISNLSIVASLKGRALTTPSVTGGAGGATQSEAYDNAKNEMNELQTILQSGSLPVKFTIERSFTISPLLGDQFANNALLVGLAAVLTVTVIVFIKFRKLAIALPMFGTMVSEIVLLLGLAAFTSWQLDLAAIAGIIIAAGTGVDDQIVITSEVLSKERSHLGDWKRRLKKAFFIIMVAYCTTVVAMLPLWWAGAGLLKGFAFTTIAGVTFGVFITRPAYAAFIEKLLN